MAAETVKNWWIQIPGVQGEGTANQVAGYIELISFSLDMAAEVTGLGKSPSKPVFHPCSVGLKGDAASSLLFKNMIGCTTLGSIMVKGLKTVNSKPEVFVEYTFSNAYTLNLSFAQDMDGGLAIGTFVFVFTAIKVQAYAQNEKTGAMQATAAVSYDLPSQEAS
ncbi:MAG: Type secretion system effector, Hcp [Acidobacteriaceae bacterium]|jgi:type VI protein secretion system component Hcp|nr:Type secretion system effector, Hcp [Acidobacteriaceae bacterium]